MDSTYTIWFHHGEIEDITKTITQVNSSDAFNLITRAYMGANHYASTSQERRDNDFTQSLEDVETPLYPSCAKYTKMFAIVALYKHKVMNGWTDNSFDGLLEMLGDMLLEHNVILKSIYSVRKFIKEFDLGYDKIHACVNDCCLFRKEIKNLQSCPKCGSSRWKVDERTKKIRKGVPTKVLRYFPIIPRFERMFKSPKMVEELQWHFKHKSEDGKMRHPVDSVTWDLVNYKWPAFAEDPRYLRLGLAADGFNPFSNMSTTYRCWPVILVTYNLPPWLCRKKENIMLTLLIPGPKQPGRDIDVYLQPLIEDLQELWNNGVNVYDSYTNSYFNLRVILMWTINDFPTYGNLYGCTTKGKVACSLCGDKTNAHWLKFSRKFCYMGHRRFLSLTHPFREKKKKRLSLMERKKREEAL
ncbi:hypothetical protein Pint_14233 [Pistacia integerrima]|uniref:Uncharacterized protein n=1 Tax=Pistacia integerrima TaxID=434235 RepID=A0ACC0YCA9_9ROSI|nr:hypothetical protein Pint_14233 [Pistacia integerrima]